MLIFYQFVFIYCCVACFSKLFVSCWQKCEFSSRSPQIESQQLMKIQRKQLREKHKFEMKWMFGKIPGLQGSFRDSGGVGNQGELYFLPASKPMLKAPLDSIGKEVVIPLFPRNQVLGPAGEDYLLIYEMRYRQLFNEIKEGGVCGQIFYSQENSKMALVGTLSKVTKLARLDDGSMYLTMQGIGRFYVREVTKEKPYLLAKVQIFNDYTENIHLVQSLERKVLDEVRYSIKLMKKLNPNINYSLNEGVIRYQPRDLLPQLVSDVSNNQQVIETDVKRNIYLDSDLTEVQRHSKFSYSILEMIKTDAITKLVFVQEAILEKRYSKMLKILEESSKYLEGEVLKRGTCSQDTFDELRKEVSTDLSDLSMPQSSVPISSDSVENFANGEWSLSISMM